MIRVSYTIVKPEIKSNKLFFIRNSRNNKNKNKRHYEIRKKFYHNNKNFRVKEKKEIQWDIYYKEDDYYLKCRVDNKNQVNVFVQNTFNLNYEYAAGKIFQCSELFHSNNYPIIIIEENNGGGDPKLAYLMIQLFQMREVERSYSIVKYADNIIKNYNFIEKYGKDFRLL